MARKNEPARSNLKLNISYPEPVHVGRGLRISISSPRKSHKQDQGHGSGDDDDTHLLPRYAEKDSAQKLKRTRVVSSFYGDDKPVTVTLDGFGYLQRDSIAPAPKSILKQSSLSTTDIAHGLTPPSPAYARQNRSITIKDDLSVPASPSSRFSCASVAAKAGKRFSRAMPKPLRYSTINTTTKGLHANKHPTRTRALFIVAGISTVLVIAGIIVTILFSYNIIGRELKDKLFGDDENGVSQ